MNPETIAFLLVLAAIVLLIAWEWITCRQRIAHERHRRPLRIGERINGFQIELVSHRPFTAYYAGGQWVDREGKPIDS